MAEQNNFWWGVGIGVIAGWFAFTALGRETIKATGRAAAKRVKGAAARARKRLERVGK